MKRVKFRRKDVTMEEKARVMPFKGEGRGHEIHNAGKAEKVKDSNSLHKYSRMNTELLTP
jgi:hypothetical protein